LKYVGAAAAVAYASICIIFATDAPFLEPIAESLPLWLFGVLMTALGPAWLLGLEDFRVVFVAAVVLTALCVAAGGIVRRRSPETEWFAALWLAAAVIWAISAWVPVLFYFT
jgi:hypothetical protein